MPLSHYLDETLWADHVRRPQRHLSGRSAVVVGYEQVAPHNAEYEWVSDEFDAVVPVLYFDRHERRPRAHRVRFADVPRMSEKRLLFALGER